MKRFVDILRICFISIEFVYVLILLAVYIFNQSLLLRVGGYIKNVDFLPVFQFISIPIIYGVFKIKESMLKPKEVEKARILYMWEGYQSLKDSVFIAIFICLFCAIGAIIIMLCGKSFPYDIFAAVYLLVTGVPILTLINLVIADQNLKEYLDKYIE